MPGLRQSYQETNSISAPSTSAVLVTPNDGVDLATGATQRIFVGGAGNLNVDMLNGETILFSGIPAGTFLPIRAKRIRATTTTATLIIALY